MFSRTKLACLALVFATAAHAAPPADTMAQRMAACTACHGLEGRAGTDAYYPRIAGKPEGYLYNQLRNFKEGRRQYAPMTYLLDQLPDAYLKEIAAHFSAQHPPYPAPERSDAGAAVLERGRRLTIEGDPARKVPACVACHGARLTGAAPAIPGLLGLPRDYLNAQFGAWKNGSRRAAKPDCMAAIAERLTLADISAVSTWLAAQPAPADPGPDPKPSLPLPLACGSVPGSAP